jgi:hypothetical protein
MKLCCLFMFIAASAFCAGSEDEHHHNGCACEAKENRSSIDCANSALTLETLTALIADDCSTDCSCAACKKNFLIVQSHHDFYLHDEVPSPVEVCEHCAITRKRDPDQSDCPVAVCDNRGDEAYGALLTEGFVNKRKRRVVRLRPCQGCWGTSVDGSQFQMA